MCPANIFGKIKSVEIIAFPPRTWISDEIRAKLGTRDDIGNARRVKHVSGCSVVQNVMFIILLLSCLRPRDLWRRAWGKQQQHRGHQAFITAERVRRSCLFILLLCLEILQKDVVISGGKVPMTVSTLRQFARETITQVFRTFSNIAFLGRVHALRRG